MAFHRAKALQEAEKSVAQGKIAQAIKQYQAILDRDPYDVSILNTIGDLYIRDRNTAEGLRQFHRLAEAYVHEGFNVKAIAIYKKISKVDPNSADTLLKLAELYQLQGLSREARDQYLQATEFFKKRNQGERALEVLRKLVQLDGENVNYRSRLAAECEHANRREEAAHAYLESAEILLRREDQGGAEKALKKAAELDPNNSKILILRARVAITRHQPEEAESIINASPELQADPVGKRILLDSYLGTRKIPQAEKLVGELFGANPTDFAPVSGVSALLVETGEVDRAYHLLAGAADSLISQSNTGPLLEALRQIWRKAPQHVPTLKLIYRISELTSDESTLSEVLEALGRAYEEAGDLEKAEAAYLKLAEREPENEDYRGLLNAVLQKLGKEIRPLEFPTEAMALEEEEEVPEEPEKIDAEQEAMLKEALENSDLFARYNLTQKAVAELEKVLQVYPDQVEIHRRILEISRKGYPGRAAAAATELARIFTERGDAETANKYHAIATTESEIAASQSSVAEQGEATLMLAPGASVLPDTETTAELSTSPIAPGEEVAAAAPAPQEGASINLGAPPATGEPPAAPPPPSAAEPPVELDLSSELETAAVFGSPAPAAEPAAPPPVEMPAPAAPTPAASEPAPPAGAPTEAAEPTSAPEGEKSSDIEEGRIEVEFYLENGFWDEARKALTTLEERYPDSPLVADLRQRLEAQAAPPVEPPVGAVHAEEAAGAETPGEGVEAEWEVEPAAEPAPAVEEAGHEEWAFPAIDVAMPSSVPQPAAPPSGLEPAVEEAGPAESGATDLLGDLAGELASSMEGLTDPAGASYATPPTPPITPVPPTPSPAQGVEQLSSLLAEMEESDAGPAGGDDPETHYNLGVAFREMGLLDEAIGEFQKVAKGAGKGNFPPNFLQACSLLAICFMDKMMPAIAARWYIRALETPGLDDEALMALQYDLGVAYERAGDFRNALERFTEVYSQNIDFRDVADKIRELQQKA